jgi:hypothetical protein
VGDAVGIAVGGVVTAVPGNKPGLSMQPAARIAVQTMIRTGTDRRYMDIPFIRSYINI